MKTKTPERPTTRWATRAVLLASALLQATFVLGQESKFYIGYASYANKTLNPAGEPGAATNGIALFSGNVSALGGTGSPFFVSGGVTNYLTRSAVGQSFEGGVPKAPDFSLGESMTNPPGTSLAFAPDIAPAVKAFWKGRASFGERTRSMG